jgi:hypothetical protein
MSSNGPRARCSCNSREQWHSLQLYGRSISGVRVLDGSERRTGSEISALLVNHLAAVGKRRRKRRCGLRGDLTVALGHVRSPVALRDCAGHAGVYILDAEADALRKLLGLQGRIEHGDVIH